MRAREGKGGGGGKEGDRETGRERKRERGREGGGGRGREGQGARERASERASERGVGGGDKERGRLLAPRPAALPAIDLEHVVPFRCRPAGRPTGAANHVHRPF